MLKADDFRTDSREISGWPVSVTSYKIGKTYFCHVDNVEPGTTIARVEGETYDEVVTNAITLAEKKLISKTL